MVLSHLSAVEDAGFAVLSSVLDSDTVCQLGENLRAGSLRRSKAGVRHALQNPAVAAIAHDPRLLTIAREVLGPRTAPFRATLFDKSPESNWLVVWHQDTALPLRKKQETPGWGPWSVKDGITYAHAPAGALAQILALRVHLDDSLARNGPLRVLPGTHTLGVLSDESIHELAARVPPADCLVSRGGILAMRPLIVHASSKSQSAIPRRVLHIEYAASLFTEEGLELAAA